MLESWVDPSRLTDSSAPVPLLVDQTAQDPDASDGFVGDSQVRREYARWSSEWRSWAERDRRSAPARRWYEELSGVHRQLSQQDDQFELVLQTGLLSWLPEDGERVRNHLLSTRLSVDVDARTGALALLVADPAGTRLHDRDLLDGLAGFDGARAEPARATVRAGLDLPLDDSVHEVLEQWRALALPSCRAYAKDVEAPADVEAVPALHFAPAIVLRPRGRASLLAYYDRMSEALQGADAEAPLGLVQLLESMEPQERLSWLESEGGTGATIAADPLFPLPANDEQRKIIERLGRDTGVVVQGPPGTGKTHTIANLVSALVAEGQRVLVTSQKAQALSVLREKIPADVRELCVSMTDQGRGGSAELSRSVNALVDRHGQYDAVRYATRIAQLGAERAAARSRQATLMEDIRSLREAETYAHPEGTVAAGYGGTLAAIAARLRERADRYDWMPTPVPQAAPAQLPVDAAAVGELVRLTASATPERRARTAQVIPSVNDLPTPERVASLVAAEQATAAAAGAAVSDLVSAMEPVSRDVLAQLEHENEVVRTTLAGLSRGDAGDEWQRRCIDDSLRGRNTSLWQGLHQVSGRAEDMNRALDGLALQRVVLPDFEPSGPEGMAAQLTAGRALRAHAAAGGKIRAKGMFRSAPEKQAERLLAATVNDVAPSTVEQLDVVLTQLAVEVDARELIARWADVGHEVLPNASVRLTVSSLVDAHHALSRASRALEAMSAVRELLRGAGVTLALDSREEWTAFADALPGVAAQLDAQAARRAVEELLDDVQRIAAVDRAAPECRALARAVALRDVAGYAQAHSALADAAVEAASQRRADELARAVEANHPGLSALIDASAADPAWTTRLGDLEGAWAWGKASTFFQDQRRPGREAVLDRQLAEVTASIGSLTGQLAAEKAWDATLSRMTARQSQALRAYQSATQSRGAGTGKFAHRFALAAKEAMTQARGAVPAWIMPLAEVLETVPPDKNSFDVVIIDEASQASIETLYLLWLAPRVIVVGDDRQCAPSQVAMGALQPIFDKLDTYLAALPNYLRVSLTPKDSLFSLLTTRFGSVIRLREHFRCMPEIIDWSSREFYADAPLVPLRQYGSDRLAPLRVRYVQGAPSEGENAKLRNRREAAAIAQQVAACIADPAYAGKTFGVVVLQGQAQVDVIEQKLRQVVRPDVYEQRRLRVGTPPDFQGDERNVIMLSLVVGPNRTNTAQTSEEAKRRYNVGASRAQDQMWLFHSVTADSLKPTDLRRSLLTHLSDPPAPRSAADLGNVTPDVRHPVFDSLFEQRVYLAIRERGYQVTPQWEVNGRRIDLVVTGAKGRLAVECDGEAWHSSPEQVASDVYREQELKRAGWRFWRVRDSEFNWDRDAALESLWSTLEERGIRPHETTTDDEPHVAVVADVVPTVQSDPIVELSAAPAAETTSSAGVQTLSVTPAEVRAWGRENGWPVGERGRLRPELITAYREAHEELSNDS
ncbi:AAA domain-containing protein [Kineococcus arenarius]|uniref:AAA domain-containing protein n=1 Tax=Kineococcus sp. SYSU DK007 TaxID=3383128 RepID=UPI003D7C6E03